MIKTSCWRSLFPAFRTGMGLLGLGKMFENLPFLSISSIGSGTGLFAGAMFFPWTIWKFLTNLLRVSCMTLVSAAVINSKALAGEPFLCKPACRMSGDCCFGIRAFVSSYGKLNFILGSVICMLLWRLNPGAKFRLTFTPLALFAMT